MTNDFAGTIPANGLANSNRREHALFSTGTARRNAGGHSGQATAAHCIADLDACIRRVARNFFSDIANPRRFVEEYMVETWGEHVRQHYRGTASNSEAWQRVRAFHIGPEPPRVLHLIARLSQTVRSQQCAERSKAGSCPLPLLGKRVAENGPRAEALLLHIRSNFAELRLMAAR